MIKNSSQVKMMAVCLLLLITAFACRKKYPYSFPDGTPGKGADSAKVTVDTAMSRIDASGYSDARLFPGLIGPNEPRLKDYGVTMDLNYKYVGKDLRISVPPQPQFSVGLYAPPGELIEVDVPAGLYSLSMQIGAWTDNLSNKENPKRVPVIYSRQQLVPGKNYMRNLYGGTIYIWAARPVPNPVTLTFTGAVKSPDFILGKTDPAQWWQDIQKSQVPWLELRSPNLIVTLPRNRFIQEHITDPSKAIGFWNDVIGEDYYGWMGLSDTAIDPLDQAPRLPYRAVLDIEISAGYGHNGYPVMMFDDQYWFNSFADYAVLEKLDAWGTFHELGHNCQQNSVWSWDGMGETTNNLFIFKTAHRLDPDPTKFFPLLHQGLTKVFGEGVAFAEKAGSKKFDDNTDPFFKLLPFLQIYQKVGWGFMPYLYSQARHAKRLSSNNQDKKDFVYEALCNYAHKDFKLFFAAWGISVSDYSQAQIAAKGYPLMTQMIWTYNPITDTGGTGIYNPYNPSYWKVADFSSEETSGEGAVNGRAKVIIDGNIHTYWAAKWTGGGSQPPQWVTIDMGSKLAVGSFTLVQRQGGRYLKQVDIQVANDTTQWQDLGYFSLQNINSPQTITLSQTLHFRYFKIYLGSTQDMYDGTPFFDLAEAWVNAP